MKFICISLNKMLYAQFQGTAFGYLKSAKINVLSEKMPHALLTRPAPEHALKAVIIRFVLIYMITRKVKGSGFLIIV